MFFAREDNLGVLERFIRDANAAHVDDPIYNKRLVRSKEIVAHIVRNPSGWDSRCEFNSRHIGDQFIDALRNFDPSQHLDIDNIYSMSYRFLCEFDFLIGAGKELTLELRSIKNRIQEDSDEMDANVRSQIHYASYVMPANITKDFLNDERIDLFRRFEERQAEAESLKEKWDREIEKKETSANALKDKLEEYESGFNFVGLYQGFEDLLKKKKSEARILFLSLLGLGVLALAPLLLALVLSVSGIYSGELFSVSHLVVLIPLVSIEVLLLYFFRIVLVAHRSAKAQIMQIELRQTLCQFIQSYASYASEIKKEDSSALEKFESLIFSGILSNSERIPSTFDGVDQLVSLADKVRGSK
ncbi:hypothetical protein GM160_07445 [Guyparkeria halophila]|uniref:Uncharacterized protein n=2 Tax=Guyparkeria halophila TaxID=47960 RepID=A0A6I6CZD0_9GAMM|nr:hypothetical protein GM160_07445 [Guyparkeria halophila]